MDNLLPTAIHPPTVRLKIILIIIIIIIIIIVVVVIE